MFIFVVDVVMKMVAFRRKYFDLADSWEQFICGIYIIVYAMIGWIWVPGYEVEHIMNFLLVLFMLIRCKSCTF